MNRTPFPGRPHRRNCKTIKISKVSYGRRTRVRITKAPRDTAANPLTLFSLLSAAEFFRKRSLVELQFYHPSARAVCVTGRFGKDGFRTLPLEHLGGGAWVTRIILPPGKYEYHFLADGEWKPDPLATEFSRDSFGKMNSVLMVE